MLAAFGGGLTGPFVFDDFGLLNDPAIAAPSGWWQCFRPTQTRPFTWFTFWVSYRLGGENPMGYHAASLALHLGVAALLWDVLRRLIPERAAAIATALFALHPMLAEPVVYVFARGTLLAALFSLLAARSWVRDRPWAAAGWFAVAMLAKEECAALPVFLRLLDVSRVDVSRGRSARARPLAAMFAIALVLGLRVIWATAVIPGAQSGPQAGISPLRYLAAEGPVILGYLFKLVLPWGFSIDYPSAPAPMALAAAAWAGVAALLWLAWRWFSGLRAGFWFVAGLVLLAPSSSIFPAADLANDRRMYLPLMAFAACAGVLLRKVKGPWLAGVTAAYLAIAIHYTSLWRSPEALWTEAVKRAPAKLRPRLQLARVLPPPRALAVLEEARLLAPGDPAVPSEQGRIRLELNQPAEALEAFGRALALDPNNARALNNRGAALAAWGQPEAARADFERALALDPCLFDARLNLARMGVPAPDRASCRYTPRQEQMLAGSP